MATLARMARLVFLNDSPWSAGLATDHFGDVFLANSANDVVREVSAFPRESSPPWPETAWLHYPGDGGPATSTEYTDAGTSLWMARETSSLSIAAIA